MKVLRVIAFSAVAAVICSCAEITPKYEKNQAINFNVDAESLTKGEIVKIGNLNEFKVTALAGEDGNYFTDLAVTSMDQGKSWNPEQTYFWPSFEMPFYAYANANGTAVINATTQKIEDFSVASEVAEQKDFVVAYAVGSYENNATTGLDLAFRHATASIKVNAVADNDGYVVKVYGVKIGNMRGCDTFTFPQGAVSGSNWSSFADSKYDKNKTSADYKVVYTEPVTLGEFAQTVTPSGNNYFVIPQTRAKWAAVSVETNTAENQGSYISLLVNITTKDGAPIYPKTAAYMKDGVNAAWDAVGVDFAIEPGQIYTYTIKFFGNGGGGQQDPEDPEDEDKGGDPVLKGAIQYTVTVDPWVEGGNTNIQMN